jgi:PEGA domain
MRQYVIVAAAALLLPGLGFGGVERSIVITSEPLGAMVYRNGIPLGITPVDDHFVYYGKYHFTFVKEKCETLQVDVNIEMPWYEIPGIDFVSENLNPCKVRDVHRIHQQLKPLQPANQQELLLRARELQARGQSIGAAAPQPVNRPVPQQMAPIAPGAPVPATMPGTPPASMPVGPPLTQPPIAATLNPTSLPR